MSAYLIAFIGIVYAIVAGDLLWRGNTGLGIAVRGGLHSEGNTGVNCRGFDIYCNLFLCYNAC